MSTTIDTLRIYERLKNANLTDTAAKEIAEVFKETIDEQLTTKKDLAILRSELEIMISKTKAEIIKWVAAMLVAQAAVIAALVKLL